MLGPTFLENLLTSINAPEDIVERYNKSTCEESEDEENQQDNADGICDIVLEIPDPNAFDNDYSHLNGLASLPKPGVVLKRTSAVPEPGSAQLAGRAEVSLRTAMRFDRISFFETEEDEPDWEDLASLKFFAGWETLVPYKLPESRNLVQEVVDRHQARWDAANINVNAGVGGGGIEGFFGIVHGWFHPTEWISLYRAKGRDIYAWAGRDISSPDQKDLTILSNLERALFDTAKYRGISEFITVLTYSEGYHGVATLLQVSLEPRHNMASKIEPLATMKDVPKEILRSMQKQVTSVIKLVQRGDKIRCVQNGGQDYAAPARVTTVGTTKKGKSFRTSWDIGDGWRQALGIRHDKTKEKDGIVTTIPQMIALLHLKGSGLHNIESSPIAPFFPTLEAVPHEDDIDQLAPDWKIGRGLKILNGPQQEGHFGNKVTVVVIFPQDSVWAGENILWA